LQERNGRKLADEIPRVQYPGGGGNGGLLMGAFLTQRPGLARTVVARVGIHDMLCVELDANRQSNTTEFGTVKDLDQFKALFAYSPFHHVRDGVKYPAVLLTTGENDGRVNPAQSRKMALPPSLSPPRGRDLLSRSQPESVKRNDSGTN
jgi:prolyl oligopeptidase